ncbi:MAG: YlbF family regulator [Leptospirales bacterium]|nr:YlbF family regulator [Leptospirales bacterium]
MKEYNPIIEKAKELASMIKNHEISLRYRDSLAKMKQDAASQKLLMELIRIGGELNNSMDTNSDPIMGKAESEILKNEFNNNKLVKDHILIQKEYIDFIKKIQDRIKNPIKK